MIDLTIRDFSRSGKHRGARIWASAVNAIQQCNATDPMRLCCGNSSGDESTHRMTSNIQTVETEIVNDGQQPCNEPVEPSVPARIRSLPP